MQKLELELYRVKIIKPKQLDLFSPDITPMELFKKVIAERPRLKEVRNDWRIGNIVNIQAHAGKFAVGKIGMTQDQTFDESTGDFVDVDRSAGPNTLVYFDSKIGLIAIARKASVANSTQAIANKIRKIFEGSEELSRAEIPVLIEKILVTKNFFTEIRDAFSVASFRVSFTGPNPIDADELFQKPLSYYCKEVEAEQGVVEVKGDSLNKEVVVAVAKSTQATGNFASAKIRKSATSPLIKISFSHDPVRVDVPQTEDPINILIKVQEAYREIRE